MTNQNAFRPKQGFVPTLKADEVNIISCIKIFDMGYQHIYIVDDNGKYTDNAIDRRAFSKIWETGQINARLLPAVPREIAEDSAAVQNVLNEIFAVYPGCMEIPITNNGRISAVNINYTEPQFEPEWGPYIGWIGELLKNFKKVFISSVASKNLKDFFFAALPYCGRKLMPLRNDNLNEALSSENLLIFGEDVYPAINKRHILNVYGALMEIASKNMEGRIRITNNITRLKASDVQKPEKIIRAFDEGAKSLVVESENEEFIGIMVPHNFSSSFPASNYPVWGNIRVDYEEDEEKLKHILAQTFLGGLRHEIPIIKDGKAVAMANLENGAYLHTTERELFELKQVHWEYVSTATVKAFFEDKPKVLLSSLTGNLKTFYERYASILDITVYRDAYLEAYLSGDYDILLYEAEVWEKSRSAKLNINDLYVWLLKKELSN